MKKKVIQEIKNHLAQELAELAEIPETPSSQQRILELQRLLLQYQFLPVPEYTSEDVICPASLVELELDGRRSFCFIVPQGGGMVMQIDGKPIQVVSPQSPLGEALLGKRVGQTVQIETSTRAVRIYSIVSLL